MDVAAHLTRSLAKLLHDHSSGLITQFRPIVNETAELALRRRSCRLSSGTGSTARVSRASGSIAIGFHKRAIRNVSRSRSPKVQELVNEESAGISKILLTEAW